MRIVHVVPTYWPAVRYGGPIVSVHGLCRALAARGHEVSVFTTSVDGPGDLDVPLGQPVNLDGVRVTYFPSRYFRRLYWSPEMAKALNREIQTFDVVHLHSIFLWPTWAAARAARRFGVPYGISPRGMLVEELVRRKSRWAKSAWLSLIERANLEHAAFLHATSQVEADEARRFGYSLPEIEIIPNGIGNDIFPEEASMLPALPPSVPIVLFVGRVNWKKGLDRLIPAMRQFPDAFLVVAGNDEEGYADTLRRLATQEEIGERVLFVGPVRGKAKAELMRRANVLVLPSYSENFGNVVVEAMAEGCPVAVTGEVGLAPIVRGSGAGIVLPGEPSEMGRALRDLVGDQTRCAKMGSRGRETVRDKFSWDVVAERMESIYRRMAQGRSPRDSRV